MRILYVSYGPQSGVTSSISSGLVALGSQVEHVDALKGLLYQVRPGSRVPNLRPQVVRAVGHALAIHGKAWKSYYLHSAYLFDVLSSAVGARIERTAPDHVLQAGVLFGPGAPPLRPYSLYLDHTRAIAERYESVPGLPPPLRPYPSWSARERIVYRNAESIFVMSEHVKASLVDDYGVDVGRIDVVGAGPNVEPGSDFQPADRDGLTILFVGKNFVPKGGPDLLDAFERLRRDHRSARLWIVASTAPTRLPEGARFFGLLDRRSLAELYSRASIFALPTLREAFGLSFLEAMSFGLPCIGTRIEAIPEIIAEGSTGFLVPPRKPEQLHEALRALVQSPELAARFGEAGRRRVRQRFGWPRAAARISARISEHLAGRASAFRSTSQGAPVAIS